MLHREGQPVAWIYGRIHAASTVQVHRFMLGFASQFGMQLYSVPALFHPCFFLSDKWCHIWCRPGRSSVTDWSTLLPYHTSTHVVHLFWIWYLYFILIHLAYFRFELETFVFDTIHYSYVMHYIMTFSLFCNCYCVLYRLYMLLLLFFEFQMDYLNYK